jgi:threonine/homoserine/homoserine lactone efflux protein
LDSPLSFLLTGTVLGLAAGLSPGPLLVMVITRTLRHGPREGVKTAFAPLLSDLPIVLAATLLLAGVADHGPALGLVSLAGALFLAYLGAEGLRGGALEVEDAAARTPRSLTNGALVNLLNPQPYLFWITVGAPTVLQGWKQGWLPPALFVGSFYVCLVGSKVGLALLTGRSRAFLGHRAYAYVLRGLGAMLLLFAAGLLLEAVRRLT